MIESEPVHINIDVSERSFEPPKLTQHHDMHRHDILAAIRKSGWLLKDLMRETGLCRSAGTMVFVRPWPRVEAIIAAHLELRPQDIWPSRYGADGQPRTGRSVQSGTLRRKTVKTTHRNKGERVE